MSSDTEPNDDRSGKMTTLMNEMDSLVDESDNGGPDPVVIKSGDNKVVKVPPKVMGQYAGLMHGISRIHGFMRNEMNEIDLQLQEQVKEAEQKKSAIQAAYNTEAIKLARKIDVFISRIAAKYRPPFYPWKLDSEEGGFVYDRESKTTEEEIQRQTQTQNLAKQGIRIPSPLPSEKPEATPPAPVSQQP